jgi:hypothetical protein
MNNKGNIMKRKNYRWMSMRTFLRSRESRPSEVGQERVEDEIKPLLKTYESIFKM